MHHKSTLFVGAFDNEIMKWPESVCTFYFVLVQFWEFFSPPTSHSSFDGTSLLARLLSVMFHKSFSCLMEERKEIKQATRAVSSHRSIMKKEYKIMMFSSPYIHNIFPFFPNNIIILIKYSVCSFVSLQVTYTRYEHKTRVRENPLSL